MGYRRFITRKDIREEQNDFPSSFLWELEITKWPQAIYYPGDRVFKTRLVKCTPPVSKDITVNTEKIHGQSVHTYGEVDHEGQLTCVFRDFQDLSIQLAFTDWYTKISSPENKMGLRKEFLVMNATLFQLDRDLNPIKSWVMDTGLLASYESGEDFGGENTPQPNVSCTIKFEQIVQNILTA